MPHGSMQNCIEACNDCAVSCDHCAAACLGENEVRMLARCIALDVDCAAVCRTAVGLMSRGSELSAETCDLCARVCDTCAEECERHDMDHCRECAQACRRCAEECRQMAGSGAGKSRANRIAASPH